MITADGWATVDVEMNGEETVPGGVLLLPDQISLSPPKGNILNQIPIQVYFYPFMSEKLLMLIYLFIST